MKLGKFNASIIPYTFAIAVFLSIILVQVIAVKQGHEKPYPQVTISRNAKHYPQYLIFRIGTISGSTLLIITWFLNYFFLNTVYPQISKYFPIIPTIIGSFAGILLMFSTCLLNTGKNPKIVDNWHVICATSFFLLTSIAETLNTIHSIILYIKTKQFSKVRITAKIVLTIVILLWVGSEFFYNSPNPNFGNILQYNLAFCLLGYILMIGYDMRNYNISYVTNQ